MRLQLYPGSTYQPLSPCKAPSSNLHHKNVPLVFCQTAARKHFSPRQGASLAAGRQSVCESLYWSFSTISLFFKLFKRFFKNTSTIAGCFNDLLFSYSSSSFFRLLHKAALTRRVWNNAKARMTEKPLCPGRQLHYSHSKLYNCLLSPIILQNVWKGSDT